MLILQPTVLGIKENTDIYKTKTETRASKMFFTKAWKMVRG